MNYDRIILELLDRVAALEDEVKKLKGQTVSNTINENATQNQVETENGVNPLDFKNPNISQTVRAVNYISYKLKEGIDSKREYVDIVALDIEHAIGTQYRTPLVCNAMRKDYGFETEVLCDTASHNSTTYKMRYYLNRPKED